jgi:hypothetical protein
MAAQQGVITKAYQRQFEDPIVFQAGERVRVTKRETWDDDDRYPWLWCINAEGKAGWTPESFIVMEGEEGVTQRAYSALELTVAVDELVQVGEEAAGWYWVTNEQGQQGWVPISHIALR